MTREPPSSPPPSPPPPPDPPAGRRPGATGGRDRARPASPPGDEEVYDLGSTAGEESEEAEREAALQELVELEAARTSPADDDEEMVEIEAGDESDEAERAAALQELVEHEKKRAALPEEAAPDFVIETGDVDEAEAERALRELIALESQRPPAADDDIPIVEIKADEADDLDRLKAVQEVVKLGSDRPTRRTERPSAVGLPTGDASDDEVRARAVLEVVEHAVRMTQAVNAAKPMESYRSRPIILAVIAIPCLLLSLYTVMARPDWVYGPDPTQRSAVQREAHLRFAMYLAAQKVYDYAAVRRGFLPQSLAEVGEEWPGIQYRLISNTEFEIRAMDGTVAPIFFRSTQDPRPLLEQGRPHLRAQP